MRERKPIFFLVIFATLALGIVIGTVITNGVRAAKSSSDDIPTLNIPSPVQLSSQFTTIARQVEPAVVNITVEATVKTQRLTRRPRRGDPFDDPFQFFDRFFGPDAPDDEFTQRGVGSGFVVDPRGYILTNHHVVAGADRITVKLADGTEFKNAEVKGSDQETDLAVIKVNPKGELAYAKMGNSDSVQVGDWVLAIGSPFGLEQTLTAGIISAKNRDGVGAQFQKFLQTDAAINQGNSGGPLVNMAGQVIGINTAIATNTGVSAGVGFALPSNTAIKVFNQLVRSGRVQRGSIGIQRPTDSKPQTPALLRSFGATDGKGVVIENLKEGGPAERANLKRGDVIREIDGKTVENWEELVNIVADLPVGKKVQVKYLRSGKEETTTLVIADRTELFRDELSPSGREENNDRNPSAVRFGLRLQELTPQMARSMNWRGDEGVLIASVESGSIAEEAGLRRNDLLLEVNREPVRTVQDFRRIEQRIKSGDYVLFLYARLAPGPNPQFTTAYVGATVP